MPSRLTSGSLLLCLLLTASASAQRHRDPSFPYLVEGRVLDAEGAPLRDVEVLRVRGPESDEPYSAAYRQVTAADGAFRFEFHGLGWGPGRTWYLRASRAGCPATTVTVHLHHGDVGGGRRGSVARGVVIRMPACPSPAPR